MKLSRLKFNSVIVRFIALMMVALVIPFALLLLHTTNRLSTIERESANQYLSSNLRTVSQTVDQNLRSLEFSHSHMFSNRDFVNGVHRLDPYDIREMDSDFRNITGIRNSIFSVAAANAYIDSIYVHSFIAQRFFSSRINWDPAFNHFDGEGYQWLDTYFSNDLSYPWHITREIREERPILSSYREVRIYGHDLPIALVSINVDASTITQHFNQVTPDEVGYVFIMDGNENIIYQEGSKNDATREIINHMPTEEREGYFDIQFEDQELFVSFYTSTYSGFRYVIATSLDQIQTSVPIMRGLIMLFFALICFLVLLLLLLVRHYFYRPITTLYSGMKELQGGNFAIKLPRSSTSEIDFINSNFNYTVESLQKQINENYASKLLNKEIELRNLQNQINEHFLYNTLDSIRWLARKEEAHRTSDMVLALANFYRLSLSSGKEVIPMFDVIAMLKNYLSIQKYRLGDSLSYSINCDSGLLNQRILKNLLQPIVENAIVHGISGLDKGTIEVNISNTDGTMKVMVTDNGKGFTSERMKQVREQLDLETPFCEQSFALKSLQSQMEIFYGYRIPLHVDSTYGQGTKIWFYLPILTEGVAQDDKTVKDDYCR